MLHQAAVVGGFLLQRHGVGARGGGHAPQAHRAAGDGKLVAGTHLRHGDAIVVGEDGEALLPGAYHIVAQRQADVNNPKCCILLLRLKDCSGKCHFHQYTNHNHRIDENGRHDT